MPGNEPDAVLAASAIVTDGAGRVLLTLRGREPARGRWSVPGGKLEAGETYEDAAARETLEETGLRVRIGKLLSSVRVPADDGKTYEIHSFKATVIGGTLRAGDDAADARWFAPHGLAELPLTDGLLEVLHRAGVGRNALRSPEPPASPPPPHPST